MNEEQFSKLLQGSLDARPLPADLGGKVAAGVHRRSLMTGFIATAVPTFFIVAVAAIVFGLRVFHLTATTAQVSPRPSISPTVSPAPKTSCRLPLSVLASRGGQPQQIAGFLTYPNGSFSADPDVHPATTIWAFDAPLHRWVPALAKYLAPDGEQYIANTTNDSLVVVNIRTGGQTTLVKGGVVAIFGWGDAGVVFSGQAGTRAGILVIDPQTLVSRQLSVHVLLPQGRVDRNALWLVGVDSNNGWHLDRVDLATGQESVWYTFAPSPPNSNALPQLQGFDKSGDPVVVNAPSGFEGPYQMLLVTGQQQATSIYSGTKGSAFRPAQQAIGDGHGIWFRGTDGSLWLYNAAQGLHAITLPAGTPTIGALGGPCA